MKKIHLLLLFTIAIAIAIILATLVDASTYVTFNVAQKQLNKNFTVIGTLNTNKPIDYLPKKNILIFYALDKDFIESKVIFLDAKPQDFERSEEITMTGYATDTAFIANKILMKCPSKYNETNEIENTNKIGTY